MIKHILVLNMGLKSIRSAVFNSTGKRMSFAALPLKTSLNDEVITQDPDEWLDKAGRVIHESLRELRGIRLDYLTVTASSSCLLYVDRECKPLDKCIMVSDKRAWDEGALLEQSPSFASVREQTGLGADISLMLPKILWVKRHQPGIYNRVYKFLSPNDFLIAKMTSYYVTDYFNAQKYHYHPPTGRYPLELLAELDIKPDLLPEVVVPGDFSAALNAAVAEEWDVLDSCRDTRVVVSSYDAICSFFGSGVAEEGEASDASGTVTAFRVLTRRQNLKASQRIFTMPFREWGLSLVGGSNNMGGGLIEWVKQCYYAQEQYPYEVIEKDARESTPGARGLLFLPYLMGERAPIWDHNARGVYFGLERFHTRREMSRAVFESTGFIVMDMIQAVEETGVQVGKIKLSGGLSRLHQVSQIKADVTGRDVEVVSEYETTAVGAAIIALVGQKIILQLDEAARRFAMVRMVIHPDPTVHKKYVQIYRLYKDLYKATRELFQTRIDMMQDVFEKHEVTIENL